MSRPYNYASTVDVNALLSFVPTFTATSRPNATQVNSFLNYASNDLDSVLSLAHYDVPIATGATVSMELLRGWAAIGGAWHAAAAMPQGIDSKHEELYRMRWSAILNGLSEGELTLPDVDPGGSAGSGFGARSGVGSIPTGGSPYFTRVGESAMYPHTFDV